MGLGSKRKLGSEKSPKVVGVFRRGLRRVSLGFDFHKQFIYEYQLFAY
jgi:hypothetical protein